MKPLACFGALVLAQVLAIIPHALGDWTHYRGSTHDGIYSGLIRTNWTAEPPRLLWRVPIGAAHSSFTVSGHRVFTQARRTAGGQEREFVVALDAANGNELWAANVDVANYPLDTGIGSDAGNSPIENGPRSTPVLDGDRVYVLSSQLTMACFDAATGQEIWRRNFPAELGAEPIAYSSAASPLVMGDYVYLNANTPSQRLMALNKADGTTAWRAHDDPPTHATPIPANFAGTAQVIYFTVNGLVSVHPESGVELWRYPFPFSLSTAATPVVAGDLVFCTAPYVNWSAVARISSSANGLAAGEVWIRRGLQAHWATPVHHEGHIYGIFRTAPFQHLRCLEMTTGETRWEALAGVGNPEFIGYGSVLKAGGYLFSVSEGGRVAIANFSTNAYEEIDSFPAFEGPRRCWNNPAIENGILYVRSRSEAAAFEIGPRSTDSEPLVLSVTTDFNAGRFQVRARAGDGLPLDDARAGRLRLLTSTQLSLPVAAWAESESAPVLSDGQAVFDLEIRRDETARFHVVRESP